MADVRILPPWAEDLRRRYLRNEAVLFVLHGNVHDLVLVDGALKPLTEFLTDVFWKDVRDTIAVYNLATGVKFAKKAKEAEAQAELMREAPREKALAGLERLLVTSRKVGVVVEYAETIAPAGDPSFQGDLDRASIVTLHRWSFLPQIEKQDNVVLLVAENLAELSPKLVSNPKVAVVDVPMPDRETRRAAARIVDTRLSEKEAERYADLTAGLKLLQIEAILAPPPPAEEDRTEREAFIARSEGERQAAINAAAGEANAIRAVAENPEVAALMGVNVGAIVATVSFISAALAGAAGILIGLNFNAIEPYMGEAMMLRGFVVIILGGLGDIRGALIAALALGCLEVMTAGYISSDLKEAVAFAALVLTLWIRPTGLFGRTARKRA